MIGIPGTAVNLSALPGTQGRSFRARMPMWWKLTRVFQVLSPLLLQPVSATNYRTIVLQFILGTLQSMICSRIHQYFYALGPLCIIPWMNLHIASPEENNALFQPHCYMFGSLTSLFPRGASPVSLVARILGGIVLGYLRLRPCLSFGPGLGITFPPAFARPHQYL